MVTALFVSVVTATLALWFWRSLSRMRRIARVLIRFNDLAPRAQSLNLDLRPAREELVDGNKAGSASLVRTVAWVARKGRGDHDLASDLEDLAASIEEI